MEVGIIRLKKEKKGKQARINDMIFAPEVRVVDEEGNQLGIIPLSKALSIAAERGLDLVEVAPDAKPPVCRIMDYGKYKYTQERKEREAKKNRKVIKVKEVKMTPNIEKHDYDTKMRKIHKFLEAGDRVKITIFFKGRMITHKELGEKLLEKIKEELAEKIKIEKDIDMAGRNMSIVVSPAVNKK
jgi:translation initiation factor IF-3